MPTRRFLVQLSTLRSNTIVKTQPGLILPICSFSNTLYRRFATRQVDSSFPTFETGFSLYQKRPSRPFPRPFISPPTSSFSEPLSTHDHSRLRRQSPDTFKSGFLRGHTNGDDAILVHSRYLGVADGVGAWNTKENGNAALWSRLMMHYFSIAADQYYEKLSQAVSKTDKHQTGTSKESHIGPPDIKHFLQEAYTATIRATTNPQGTTWSGTTTACCCLLTPDLMLHVVNLGDSQLRVLRPGKHEFVLRTSEQWHWFDCPRQLGTNSPDTPDLNGVVQTIQLEQDDIIILSSDGMPDNLYEHEVITVCMKTLGLKIPADIDVSEFVGELRNKTGIDDVSVALREEERPEDEGQQEKEDIMTKLASELVRAAKAVATDPYAESPWMERAIDEGLAAEGGKLDDISVVVARLKKKKQ